MRVFADDVAISMANTFARLCVYYYFYSTWSIVYITAVNLMANVYNKRLLLRDLPKADRRRVARYWLKR